MGLQPLSEPAPPDLHTMLCYNDAKCKPNTHYIEIKRSYFKCAKKKIQVSVWVSSNQLFPSYKPDWPMDFVIWISCPCGVLSLAWEITHYHLRQLYHTFLLINHFLSIYTSTKTYHLTLTLLSASLFHPNVLSPCISSSHSNPLEAVRWWLWDCGAKTMAMVDRYSGIKIVVMALRSSL